MTKHIADKNHYPHFTLETHTPVDNISTTDETKHPFVLATSRGEIKATHIIHCTNGFAAHLIPNLKGKLFTIRGQMTRQAVAPEFPRLGDRRSWIFHYDFGYDYITQSSSSTGDMYIGGGFLKSLITGQVNIEEADVGCTRDDQQIPEVLASIEGSIEKRLQHGSGTHIVDKWTGIMGFTIDNHPMVGKLPYEISERRPVMSQADDSNGGREWIAAGFCGNGMVNCWLSGKGIAEMLLKGEDAVNEWFPIEQYACSPERLQRTTLVDRFLTFVNDAAV